jgi:hypothetical protein
LLVVGAGLAHAQTRVVVVGLTFEGEVSAGLRKLMRERLESGLLAAGLQAATEQERARALAGREGRCFEPACWRAVAQKLGCRYAVGGTVRGDDQDYAISLWLGDSATGAVRARAAERCDLCGQRAAAEKMDLGASALAAKLTAAALAPARLSVASEPPGAAVRVDGKQAGLTPLELELAPGKHEVAVRAPGYLASRRQVMAVGGVSERLAVRLVAEAAPGRSSGLRIAGWASLGAGVAALAAGIALFAIDGQEVDCVVALAGSGCRQRATLVEAAVATTLGVAAGGLGGFLLYRARARERRAEARAALVPMGAGAGLAVQF